MMISNSGRKFESTTKRDHWDKHCDVIRNGTTYESLTNGKNNWYHHIS